MNALTEITKAWGPFEGEIRQALERLSRAAMEKEADFLWFVLIPFDLRGMPIMVWPTEKDQQQHDGWAHEEDLMQCVPDTVELPGSLADTPERLDLFRDACADFLRTQWNTISPTPDRLAYFSLNDDGWYFSLRDGRKISAWDIENEINEQAGRTN